MLKLLINFEEHLKDKEVRNVPELRETHFKLRLGSQLTDCTQKVDSWVLDGSRGAGSEAGGTGGQTTGVFLNMFSRHCFQLSHVNTRVKLIMSSHLRHYSDPGRRKVISVKVSKDSQAKELVSHKAKCL